MTDEEIEKGLVEEIFDSKGWFEFISFLVDKLEEHGFVLYIEEAKYLEDITGRYSGSFDGVRGIFVASGYPSWPLTLFHEAAHFLRFINNEKYSINFDANNRLANWLIGVDFDNIKEDIMLCLSDELATEKLVIKIMDEFGIPYPRERYIIKGNAYLFFYPWLYEHRIWDREVPLSKYVREVVPDRFLRSAKEYMAEYTRNYDLRLTMNLVHDRRSA